MSNTINNSNKIHFKKNELSTLLEAIAGSPTGGPSGKDWWNSKIDATVKNIKSTNLHNIVSALNPYALKHPLDRTPVMLGQAGYSKAKSMRTAQQLMNRPGVLAVVGTPAGILNPGQVAKLAGAGAKLAAGGLLSSKSDTLRAIGSKVNLGGNILKNIGVELDTPAARASTAIAVGSILGDPRGAQIKPGEIIR
jgi:hypothetical protein